MNYSRTTVNKILTVCLPAQVCALKCNLDKVVSGSWLRNQNIDVVRPLQIDFLFPVLAKQNLACGRVGGKLHYSIMLTTTLARNLAQLQMLCVHVYLQSYIVGNTCLISTPWSTLASNKQFISHFTLVS